MNTQRTIIAVVVAICASIAPPPVLAQTPMRVVVVLAQDETPYMEFLSGFRQHLETSEQTFSLNTVHLRGDAGAFRRANTAIISSRPNVIVAVGSSSLQAMAGRPANIPLIASMIVDATEMAHIDNCTGISLMPTPQQQLALLHKNLPASQRVGIVTSTSFDAHMLQQYRHAAQRLGLKIHVRQLAGVHELEAVLATMRDSVDVILALPDPVVMAPESAKILLLFSFGNRIPVVGPSAAWAKSGAIYAYDWNYKELGNQTALLLVTKTAAASQQHVKPVNPKTTRYVINMRTAQHMKIRLAESVVNNASAVY